LKFFLHISKEEQKSRLLARLNDRNKLWKFSRSDLRERAFWKEYAKAYEHAISATSTKSAPWFVIPADHKWAAHFLIAEVVVSAIRTLHLEFPEDPALLKNLSALKSQLTGKAS
jgi:polyphosphate kinase 2 (PPK2 family)